jgi:hypothetical protein
MSSSLLWLSSFIFIFLIAFVGAQSLGIMPSAAEIEVSKGQTKCISYTLTGNDDLSAINILWSMKNSRDIADYSLSGIEGIHASYPSIVNGKYFDVCYQGNLPGEYHGILFIEQRISSIILGSWVDIKVEYSKIEHNPFFISGSVIGSMPANFLLGAYVTSSFFLALLLLALLILLHRKRAD